MKIFTAVFCVVLIIGMCVSALLVWEKSVKKCVHVGLVSSETFDETAEFCDESGFVTLYKEKDRDFVILNVSDTHQSDFDYRAFTGPLARREITRLVEALQPDLITVSGDITCAKSEFYSVKAFTDFMNGLQIPWAPVFGNHDGESDNCDKNYLADVMTGGEDSYCLLKKGPNNLANEDDREGRVGNYVINIVERGTNKLCQTLYMVDTGRSHLTQKQISWYEQAARTVRKVYGYADSAMIMHIPTVEYFYAYMQGYDLDKREWKDAPKEGGAYGNCYEPDIVCCDKKRFSTEEEMLTGREYLDLLQSGVTVSEGLKKNLMRYGVPKQNGLFGKLKEYGTKNVLCGHDHLNNFYCTYDGINLMYSLKNGMGSGYRVGRNGGTVLTVRGETLTMEHYYL